MRRVRFIRVRSISAHTFDGQVSSKSERAPQFKVCRVEQARRKRPRRGGRCGRRGRRGPRLRPFLARFAFAEGRHQLQQCLRSAAADAARPRTAARAPPKRCAQPASSDRPSGARGFASAPAMHAFRRCRRPGLGDRSGESAGRFGVSDGVLSVPGAAHAAGATASACTLPSPISGGAPAKQQVPASNPHVDAISAAPPAVSASRGPPERRGAR